VTIWPITSQAKLLKAIAENRDSYFDELYAKHFLFFSWEHFWMPCHRPEKRRGGK